jgi:hypothetical protein
MTTNTAMSRGLTAAIVAAILATVTALAFLGVAQAQSISGLTIGSGEAEPEAEVTIEVKAKADGLGSYRLDILYDSTKVEAKACTSGDGVCSIDVVGPGIVRINGSNLSGISGDAVVLGSITLLCGPSEGTSNLTLDTSSLVLSDIEGNNLVLSSDATTAGTITCATAVATAVPTATTAPAAVPQTGGAPDTSSANSMAWLLAAGLAVTLAGGGAWVLARAGREN